MSPRDRARSQYWIDWVDAILEDVYRDLWDGHRGWWRRKRGKRAKVRVMRDA